VLYSAAFLTPELIATGSRDRRLKLWDGLSAQPTKTFLLKSAVTAICPLNPDTLAVGLENGMV
jgi:hypothetical protein